MDVLPITREDEPEPPDDDDCLCNQLIVLAALTHEIQMAAHLLHFNYTGANFLSIHGFLKGEYDYWLETFDTLGEFVRALGGRMPATHRELLAIQPLFSERMSTADCALTRYREDLLQLKDMVLNLEAAAVDARAIDVANSAAEIVAHIGKAVWFIEASLCS